jgi:hypothetical protein
MLRSTHRLDGVPGDPDPEPGDAQGESEERPGVAICYPVGRSAPGPEGSTQPSPCPTASPEQPPATCFSAHGDGEHEGHDPRVAASGQGSPSADRQAACRPCLLSNCLTMSRRLRCAAGATGSSSCRAKLDCRAAMTGRSSGRSGSRWNTSRSSWGVKPRRSMAAPDRRCSLWVPRTLSRCLTSAFVASRSPQPQPRPWPA